MRALTDKEVNVVMKLASSLPIEMQGQLLEDLKNCLVEDVAGDSARIRFELANYSREAYVGQHSYPCEGEVRDSDGATVSVYLYADENERLFELEFVKWADSPVKNLKWDTFRVL